VGSVATVALCMRKSRKIKTSSDEIEMNDLEVGRNGRNNSMPVPNCIPDIENLPESLSNGEDSLRPLGAAIEHLADPQLSLSEGCSTISPSYAPRSRSLNERDIRLRDWAISSFCRLINITEYDLLNHSSANYHDIYNKLMLIWRRNWEQRDDLPSASEYESTMRTRIREQIDQEKIEFAKEVQAEKKMREKIERERDDLQQLLSRRQIATDDLQRERFKFVLQDLLATCRTRELKKQRVEFDTIVEAEVISRIGRLTTRLKVEAERQKHNRKVQDSLQKSLQQNAQDLDIRFAQLKTDQLMLSEQQIALSEAQQIYTTKYDRLQHNIKELGDIKQIITKLVEKHEEKMGSEKKRLAASAKDMQTRQGKWNDALLQQRLELARREIRINEKERAMNK